jgi:hypothetical protein
MDFQSVLEKKLSLIPQEVALLQDRKDELSLVPFPSLSSMLYRMEIER